MKNAMKNVIIRKVGKVSGVLVCSVKATSKQPGDHCVYESLCIHVLSSYDSHLHGESLRHPSVIREICSNKDFVTVG